MEYKIKRLLFLIFFVGLLLGCANQGFSKSGPLITESKPMIAVSIVPEATFVQEICGDKMDVVILIPPGMSPTNYEPSPELMESFHKADIYFAIGVPTEEINIYPKIEDSTRLVKLQDIVAKNYEDCFFEDGGRDPHIWLSMKRVKVMVEAITEEICLLDEENRAYYKANEERYLKELEDANQIIQSIFSEKEQTNFITYHPAFGYIAMDYELTMYTLEKNGKEATSKHLQEMIDLAKMKNIETVFYQAEVDSRQSEAFAEEINGKVVELSPLSSNYIDNMIVMARKIKEGMR